MCFTRVGFGVDIDKPTGQKPPRTLHKYSRRIVLRVVAGQMVVALLATVAIAVAFGPRLGYSALVGALIGVLPSYYLAVRMFRCRQSMLPEQALRGIYLGEGIKVAFTVALFVAAILFLDVEMSVVLLIYLVAVAVNWIAIFVADLGESPRKRA